MSRIRKIFTRTAGNRDAKLIVIASEGQKTEPKYFKDLANFYYNSRVHVEILKRFQSASSPSHVLNELDKFKSQYSLNRNDELWMVIDLDRWPIKNLSDVASKCNHKKYNLAISNPCFEIWLLLHMKDISDYTEKEIKILEANKNKILKLKLKKILGSYNEANIDSSKFLPHVAKAIDRARDLDKNPHDRWPQSIGTRIYLPVDKIIST